MLVALGLFIFFSPGSAEVVDCIAAVVNSQVITLADLQFAEAFRIYEENARNNRFIWALEKMIDQKVVIDLARAKVSVEQEKVDEELKKVIEKFGVQEAQKKFEQLGLDAEDLKACLEEKILCQKIIDLRFSQSASVSLREIETYYNETYVTLQKDLGLEPKPMMEILEEIESQIKREKIKIQVTSWINNLRKQAEIEIKWDCINKIEDVRN